MKTLDIAGSLRDGKRGHDNLAHTIRILGEGTPEIACSWVKDLSGEEI
jgi:hypothetical protein